MDYSGITTMVTNLGFPIFCVIVLGFFVYKIWQQSAADYRCREERMCEENKCREERMFAQLDKFSTSLDNFNTTLSRIDTRLDAVEKKIEK